jgi:hypothetical protein
MFQADGNLDSNCLKEGVTDAQIELVVRMSRYPLQHVVAEQLLAEFDVTEEWGYGDRDPSEPRALECAQLLHVALKQTYSVYSPGPKLSTFASAEFENLDGLRKEASESVTAVPSDFWSDDDPHGPFVLRLVYDRSFGGLCCPVDPNANQVSSVR